jgi:hypothetical protein
MVSAPLGRGNLKRSPYWFKSKAATNEMERRMQSCEPGRNDPTSMAKKCTPIDVLFALRFLLTFGDLRSVVVAGDGAHGGLMVHLTTVIGGFG